LTRCLAQRSYVFHLYNSLYHRNIHIEGRSHAKLTEQSTDHVFHLYISALFRDHMLTTISSCSVQITCQTNSSEIQNSTDHVFHVYSSEII
jgi:hypothetical protein